MQTTFRQKLYHSVNVALDIGWLEGLKLAVALFCNAAVRIKPKDYAHSFLVRGGTSDPLIVLAVFSRKEYSTPCPQEIDLILDLGANVGYSAIYFAHHYPHARILALEPEHRNFQLLCENVSKYQNIVPMNLGIWWRKAKIEIVNPEAESWAFQFKETEGEGVDCTTIEELIKEYGGMKGVIVKMDIEGAEGEIFKNGARWLSLVDYVQIEIHGCWKAVFEGFPLQLVW